MKKFGIALAVLTAVSTPFGATHAQTPETLVGITLTDYAFTPSMLDLKAGVTYHLHLTNAGAKDHNFSAPQFFAAAQVAADDAAKVKNGAIAVDSGHAVDIAVTPGQAGTYALTCTHFMHSMMGMKGTITVR
jgi:uncharacterized cupredoxin-like copper-binding protein